jgi:protein TonB
MSYAERKQMSSNKTAAIVIVALLHVALGYVLVTGLAYNVIKQAAEDLKTFDVEEEPPPLVRTNTTAPPIISTPVAPPPVITPIARPAPPAPPAPPPVKKEPISVSGNLQGLFRTSDYPQTALDNEEQGTVAVQLSVGANGRVTGCSVTKSSGSRTLDSTTCRILTSRAKFTPARDSNGNPTTGSFPQRITWRLE